MQFGPVFLCPLTPYMRRRNQLHTYIATPSFQKKGALAPNFNQLLISIRIVQSPLQVGRSRTSGLGSSKSSGQSRVAKMQAVLPCDHMSLGLVEERVAGHSAVSIWPILPGHGSYYYRNNHVKLHAHSIFPPPSACSSKWNQSPAHDFVVYKICASYVEAIS